MKFSKAFRRELQVAFSKDAQPKWFRIVKYILLFILVYSLWGTGWLWYAVPTLLVFSLALHGWYRYKTKGWTQSYGMWKYDGK